MTKEQLEALNAAIVYFDRHPARSAAFNLARALERLRDAEAKPEQDPTEAVTSRKIRRLEQELEVARAGYKVSGQMLDKWNEWARAKLGCVDALVTGDELRQKLDIEIQKALNDRCELGEWNAWAAEVTREPGSRPQEFRDVIGDLVELGRRVETEGIFRKLDERGVTPEQAAQGVRDALYGPRAAPPWKMPQAEAPEPRPLTEAERKRLMELGKTDSRRSPGGEQENTDHAPTARHSGHLGTVPGHSELETMLTALMGPDTYNAEDAGRPWRWARTRTGGKFWLTLNRAPSVSVRFPSDALAAINARLAELAPEGWRLSVTPSDPSGTSGSDLTVLRRGVSGLLRHFKINANLGAHIAEALKWIAEREKPAVPAPDDPSWRSGCYGS